MPLPVFEATFMTMSAPCSNWARVSSLPLRGSLNVPAKETSTRDSGTM